MIEGNDSDSPRLRVIQGGPCAGEALNPLRPGALWAGFAAAAEPAAGLGARQERKATRPWRLPGAGRLPRLGRWTLALLLLAGAGAATGALAVGLGARGALRASRAPALSALVGRGLAAPLESALTLPAVVGERAGGHRAWAARRAGRMLAGSRRRPRRAAGSARAARTAAPLSEAPAYAPPAQSYSPPEASAYAPPAQSYSPPESASTPPPRATTRAQSAAGPQAPNALGGVGYCEKGC
jgi:hypothetical protein